MVTKVYPVLQLNITRSLNCHFGSTIHTLNKKNTSNNQTMNRVILVLSKKNNRYTSLLIFFDFFLDSWKGLGGGCDGYAHGPWCRYQEKNFGGVQNGSKFWVTKFTINTRMYRRYEIFKKKIGKKTYFYAHMLLSHFWWNISVTLFSFIHLVVLTAIHNVIQ